MRVKGVFELQIFRGNPELTSTVTEISVEKITFQVPPGELVTLFPPMG